MSPSDQNRMIGPGEHEGSALGELGRGKPQEAQTYAILALAAAVNRLAEAHETMANALSDIAYDQPFRVSVQPSARPS